VVAATVEYLRTANVSGGFAVVAAVRLCLAVAVGPPCGMFAAATMFGMHGFDVVMFDVSVAVSVKFGTTADTLVTLETVDAADKQAACPVMSDMPAVAVEKSSALAMLGRLAGFPMPRQDCMPAKLSALAKLDRLASVPMPCQDCAVA